MPERRPVSSFASTPFSQSASTVTVPSAIVSVGQASNLQVRRITDDDEPALLGLLVACLDWEPGERFADFYRWKHLANPFGRSPGWVALDGDVIVGLRTFLRWEFAAGAETVRAVRAVDTATHQDYRGRGIFRRLTEHAVAELTADGVAFIFNTPNVHSLPGYLKMGWQTVGQLPVLFRPTSFRSVPRLVRARVPADLWSSPSEAGASAAEVLADTRSVEALLGRGSAAEGLRTRLSAAYLQWRYGYAPLCYRAVTGSAGMSDGVAFFRLRRRGRAMEVALGDIIVPAGQPAAARAQVSAQGAARALVRRVLQVTAEADHVVRLADDGAPPAGFLRLPRRGPVLTYRPLAATTSGPPGLRLSLGDVELF